MVLDQGIWQWDFFDDPAEQFDMAAFQRGEGMLLVPDNLDDSLLAHLIRTAIEAADVKPFVVLPQKS